MWQPRSLLSTGYHYFQLECRDTLGDQLFTGGDIVGRLSGQTLILE